MVDEPEVEPQDGEPEISQLAFNTPIAATTGAIGLAPYGDEAEHTGPPEVIVYTPPFRPFFATDARSVMITLLPQHYNLIPNPAFRTNAAGWVTTGIEPAPASFSWRVANTSAQAGLTAITAKTTSTVVDPDPLTAAAYVNGQAVKVVDTLASNKTVAWLKIDNAATLTVAQAAAVGVTIGAPVPKYRVYDLLTDSPQDAADTWVGKSLIANGTGMLRYREGTDKFVYTGPLKETMGNQWDPKRGGAEYTLSVYVKGAGDVKLTMDAYNPIDRNDLNSGPEYQNLIKTATPATYAKGQAAIQDSTTGLVWTAITDPAVPTVAPFYQSIDRGPALGTVSTEWTTLDETDDWQRVVLKTRARVYENTGQVDFMGARWVDTKIEVRNAKSLRISAVMLDPSEYPVAQYFDGEMTESLNLDDFLWEGTVNNSVSYYYYDRVIRAKWLYERMGYVVPAGRPYQIFFGSYWRPYVGSSGETIVMVPA